VPLLPDLRFPQSCAERSPGSGLLLVPSNHLNWKFFVMLSMDCLMLSR